MSSGAITEDPVVVARLNETLRRFRTHFLDQPELVRTPDRLRWVGATIRPLCVVSPPVAEEVRPLLYLAFAGWCWREAEHGERQRLRDRILAAYETARRDAAVPVEFTPAWAAWLFFKDGGEPGLGSPGATDQARLAFLEAAFLKMHEHYGIRAGIELEAGRVAFQRGVVLNDIEHLALGLPDLEA